RPRPVRRAALPRARRAGERARRVHSGPGPEPARRAATGAPAHLPVHRPRSRGRETHRGSRGGHVPRQDRGTRARARVVRHAPPRPTLGAHRRSPRGPAGPVVDPLAPAPPVDDRRLRRLQLAGIASGFTAGAWLGAAEAPTKMVTLGLSPVVISLTMVLGV